MDQAAAHLSRFGEGGSDRAIIRGSAERPAPISLAFVFTGQGSQAPGMGRELYETEPVFREALDRCAAHLSPLLDRPLISLLYPERPEPGVLDLTQYTQPALFAFEYALAELWRSFGVVPHAVMGHSVGEVVAACVAGVFDLPTGLALIAARGRLMGELPSGGAMLAVMAPARVVEEVAGRVGPGVWIAAFNGPSNTVVSGEARAVERVAEEIARIGERAQPLSVSHAFHSGLMEPMIPAFSREAAARAFGAPRLKLVSNVTGAVVGEGEVMDGVYWCRHIREPVRFDAGVDALVRAGCEVMVEVGPGPVLSGMGARCASGVEFLPSLRPGKPDVAQMLESLGRLWTLGVDVDWESFGRGRPATRCSLPTYPFERQRHWVDPGPRRPAGDLERVGDDDEVEAHPLLGRRVISPGLSHALFENKLPSPDSPFLREHRVHGRVILPFAAVAEIVLAAARGAGDRGPFVAEDLVVSRPLEIPARGGRIVQTIVQTGTDRPYARIVSRSAAADPDEVDWIEHATAVLPGGGDACKCRGGRDEARQGTLDRAAETGAGDGRTSGAKAGRTIGSAEFYGAATQRGIDFGPTFRVVEMITVGDGEASGHVSLGPDAVVEAARFLVHPALLDGALQVAATLASDAVSTREITLPVTVRRLVVHRAGASGLSCRAALEPTSGQADSSGAISLVARAADGEIVLEVGGL
ncbi:MAG: acyltransferase domain-containing protein, partial [Planctomycetota bacterium]